MSYKITIQPLHDDGSDSKHEFSGDLLTDAVAQAVQELEDEGGTLLDTILAATAEMVTLGGFGHANYHDMDPSESYRVTVEEVTTRKLTLDASHRVELFHAFRKRGESSTKRAVAQFLRECDIDQFDEKHAMGTRCHWYWGAEYDHSQIIPSDGIADGGSPYTDEELAAE